MGQPTLQIQVTIHNKSDCVAKRELENDSPDSQLYYYQGFVDEQKTSENIVVRSRQMLYRHSSFV